MAEPTTIIGEFTSVEGNLQGDEDLVVLGRVEGSIQLERTLVIEPSGVVKADVTVRNAVISGVVVGNVEASESVQLTTEGRMVGDISAPRVIIVEGALFRGQVDMGETAPSTERGGGDLPEVPPRRAPARSSAPARKPAARAATPAKKKAPAASREPAPSEKPESKAAPKPSRRRPSRGNKSAPAEAKKPEAEEESKAEQSDAPPPKPRVAPKKRRVSVRKKR